MKKISITILFLISFLNISAQEINNAIDKIANETCNYFTENAAELNQLSSDERTTKLGLKMLTLYDKYKEELIKDGITIDISDDSSTEAFGEKVGFAMAKYCTEVLIALSEDYTDEDDYIEYETIGELKVITGNELSVVTLIDEQGKTQKFVWINNFEGSDRLINSDSINGLKVKLNYINIEIYSPQLKEYIVRKQVSKIEYLE